VYAKIAFPLVNNECILLVYLKKQVLIKTIKMQYVYKQLNRI